MAMTGPIVPLILPSDTLTFVPQQPVVDDGEAWATPQEGVGGLPSQFSLISLPQHEDSPLSPSPSSRRVTLARRRFGRGGRLVFMLPSQKKKKQLKQLCLVCCKFKETLE